MTTAALAHVRSLLFAPGSDSRKLERALSSDADAVVADLEDSVVAAEKGRARDVLAGLFASPGAGPGRMVRVNGADTDYFADDVEAVAGMQLMAIVLPKATPESVAALGPDGPPVVAIVETAQGVRLAYETASSDRVVALVLGAADLGAQLWLEPREDNQELLFARSKLVVDSAAAGIRAPFDVVHLNVEDDAGMEAEALPRALARAAGEGVHPPAPGRGGQQGLPAERGRGGLGARRARGVRRRRARRTWRARRSGSARRPRTRPAGAHDHGNDGRGGHVTTDIRPAPKEWRGRFFEDIEVGDVYVSRLGRTITETDNIWFTLLTLNTNQLHFNVPYAERTRFGKPLVNSAFTLALVTGMTVPDTSENATANLAWTDISMPNPVFVGDTLWAESEIVETRESRSTPTVGIVSMRCRGINQRREVVIEFRRTFMIYKRHAPEVESAFPGTETPWNV